MRTRKEIEDAMVRAVGNDTKTSSQEKEQAYLLTEIFLDIRGILKLP